MVTTQPRKQRLNLNNLPVHARRAQISSHIDPEYREARKITTRTTTLRKGDTVRVMRGDHAGTVGKVLTVDTRARKVTVEGVTVAKADKTEKARPVDPSNLLITKLDLSDALRREKLGVEGASEDETAPKPKQKKETKSEEA
ncbi:MAG TPA: 50S ribosomal protein L24 [Candidatus Thermoplasmatota archaeon]|nr:50S ribosomal protein L24 [Candidatus Thermoplasmatota archaeon]